MKTAEDVVRRITEVALEDDRGRCAYRLCQYRRGANTHSDDCPIGMADQWVLQSYREGGGDANGR